MTCRNCQASLDVQAYYCPNCGAPQKEHSTPPSSSQAQARESQETALPSQAHTALPPAAQAPAAPPERSQKVSDVQFPIISPFSEPSAISKQTRQTGDLLYEPQKLVPQLPEQGTLPELPATSAPQNSVPDAYVHRNVQMQPPVSDRQPQTAEEDIPTQVVPRSPTGQYAEQHTPWPEMMMSPLPPSRPLLYYRLNPSRRGRQMHQTGVVTKKSPYKRRRSGCGCLSGCLLVFILLLAIVGGGWYFFVRPQASALVQSQLDQALTAAVNQLPTSVKPNTIALQDTTINNLIVLNLAPSNPVKNPQTTITPGNISLSFQTYNVPSTITLVPQVQNGHVVASNISLQGAAAMVMTPDELANVLNRHLSDAQTRINRTVNAIQLKDHEMDITFS